MKNMLLSATIGDIADCVYEGRDRRTKEYSKVKVFAPGVRFTNDTVLTFACAGAFVKDIDMGWNLWKCANEHRHAGFCRSFKKCFHSHSPQPYGSKGYGNAMRCLAAGWKQAWKNNFYDGASAMK